MSYPQVIHILAITTSYIVNVSHETLQFAKKMWITFNSIRSIHESPYCQKKQED